MKKTLSRLRRKKKARRDSKDLGLFFVMEKGGRPAIE
jgi:hypothetical protein